MKKLSLLATTSAAFLFFAGQAFAAQGACPTNSFAGLCLTADQLGPVVGSFITLAFVVVGLVALAFLIYGGFKWLISEGDKTNVEAARNHIVAAIIGLIVIFLSYLVVNLLLSFVTGGKVTLNSITLPSLPQSQ